MGLILGALAGAAKGFEDAYSENRKERLAVEAEGRSDARARALVLFKQGVEDTARADMTARVAGAAGTIADRAVGAKRGLIEGNIADREAWTPEQQAAVDQSLALDRQAIAEDPDTLTAAAVQTGDIDPKSMATLDIQGKKAAATERAAAAKAEQEDRKLASREERDRLDREQRDRIADRNAEMQERRIGAMLSRAANGGASNPGKEVLAYIEGRRKELADDASNTKALYAAAVKDVSSKRRAEIDEEFKPKLAEIDAKRRQVEDDFDALRERVGLPAKRSSSAPAPAPAETPSTKPAAAPAASKPAALNKLPDGARQIGTSGGKPVYQTPDGRRFVAQ